MISETDSHMSRMIIMIILPNLFYEKNFGKYRTNTGVNMIIVSMDAYK
jgi:hypothetical protein